VSTQYLVMASWGQELICFEQNIKVGDRCSVGDDVILYWAPEHTFGLDGSEGLEAGIDPAQVRLKELNRDLLREG
jgi:spermidine/putrescine transport system ATP-binding protein